MTTSRLTMPEKVFGLIAAEHYWEDEIYRGHDTWIGTIQDECRAEVNRVLRLSGGFAYSLVRARDRQLLVWERKERGKPFVWCHYWRRLAAGACACGFHAVAAYCYGKSAAGCAGGVRQSDLRLREECLSRGWGNLAAKDKRESPLLRPRDGALSGASSPLLSLSE